MVIEVKAIVHLNLNNPYYVKIFLRDFGGLLYQDKSGNYFFLHSNIAHVIGNDLNLIKKLWSKEIKIKKENFKLKT